MNTFLEWLALIAVVFFSIFIGLVAVALALAPWAIVAYVVLWIFGWKL